MTCELNREKLGPYFDGELGAEDRKTVEGHVAYCDDCAAALADMQDMAQELGSGAETAVPSELWASIDARLSAPIAAVTRSAYAQPKLQNRSWRRPLWAMAAVVTLAVGLGIVGSSMTGSRAQASLIDFSTLLDTLDLDPVRAFDTFVNTYRGRPASRVEAKRYAKSLNFEIPDELPQGFSLDRVYLLDFGGSPGVAASYSRGEEFLAAIFHRPVKQENFGTYKDYDCVVGKHHGHKVQVGEWKMVHVTDPTTCHCVLSRLDEQTELPPILAAVAPALKTTKHHHEH